MSKRISIPIQTNYNKLFRNYKIEKVKSISKEDLFVELRNPESWIYELMRDDAISLFLNTGGYINKKFSTDDLYTLGVNITAKQISKRCFFSEIEDYDLILKKTKSRVVNNIRNYFSPFRKVNYKNMNQHLYFSEEHIESFEEILDELDLQKIDKETIKVGLAKVWQDAITDTTFDILDFEELCRKFQFQPNEILGYDPKNVPLMAKESCNNGNYQLILVFEIEEVL